MPLFRSHPGRVGAVVAVLAVVLLTGCGSGSPDPQAARAADIAFAEGMIPHHEQALEMAELAKENATTGPVKKLARGIARDQDREVILMRQWLRDWGVADEGSAPASGAAEVPDQGHEHGSAEGMASADEMLTLAQATGPAFDRLWLELMIRHHEGAVVMAESVLETTSDLEVEALAEAVVMAQSAELDRMRGLLDRS